MAALDELKNVLANADPADAVQINGLPNSLTITVSDLSNALGVSSTFRPAATIFNISANPSAGPQSAQPPIDQALYVNVPRLNVRDQPASAGNIISQLLQGSVIHVNAAASIQSDGHTWASILNGQGWIATDLIIPLISVIQASQRGVNVTAGGWAPNPQQINLIRQNQIAFVLICTYEPTQAAKTIQPLLAAGVKAFILRACIHDPPTTPDRFVQLNLPIMTEYVSAIGSAAPILIALGNEPNLKQEGWGSAWSDGTAFAQWWLTLAAKYRQAFPNALIGFPAMSPGDDVPNIRMAEQTFLAGCGSALAAADWIGVHYYWQKPDGSDIVPPVHQWRSTFGADRLIIGTEVGPTDSNQVSPGAVSRAYQQFAAVGIPDCAWLLGGSGAWKNAAWDINNITL